MDAAGNERRPGAWLRQDFHVTAEELDRFCALYDVAIEGVRAWGAGSDEMPHGRATHLAWARAEAVGR